MPSFVTKEHSIVKDIGINNNYKFLLPESGVVVYKLVNSVFMKTCHSTSV